MHTLLWKVCARRGRKRRRNYKFLGIQNKENIFSFCKMEKRNHSSSYLNIYIYTLIYLLIGTILRVSVVNAITYSTQQAK